jgi:hypothetical protein
MGREVDRKRIAAINALDQQRGSIMLATILNAFYRQVCRQYLNAMRRHRWA